MEKEKIESIVEEKIREMQSKGESGSSEPAESGKMNRRNFLKAIGLGTTAAAGVAFTPGVGALNLSSNEISGLDYINGSPVSSFGGGSGTLAETLDQGNVANQNIDMSGNNLVSGTDHSVVFGNDIILNSLNDIAFNVNGTTNRLNIQGSGPVEVANSDLKMPSGNSIMFGSQSSLSKTASGLYLYTNSSSEPIQLYDNTNDKKILEANQSGTVNIPSGNLNVSAGSIEANNGFVNGSNSTGSNSGIPNTQISSQHSVQTTMKFGAEGSTTTSTSYVTVPNSDIAIDFDELKNSDGEIYIKVKYHLYNEYKHGVYSGDTKALSDTGSYNDSAFNADTAYFLKYATSEVDEYNMVDGSKTTYSLGGNSATYNRGITHDGNYIWVLDSDGILARYNSDFTSYTTYDISGNGSYTQGSAMTYRSSDDSLYILDASNDQVDRYDTSGNYQESFSTAGLSKEINLVYNPVEDLFLTYKHNTGDMIAYDSSFNRDSSNDFNIGAIVSEAVDQYTTYFSSMFDTTNDTYWFTGPGSDLEEFYGVNATSDARIVRQNSGTAVTNTEVNGTQGRLWEFLDTGWINLSSESGVESYQVQIRANGGIAKYNSVVLYIGVPPAT